LKAPARKGRKSVARPKPRPQYAALPYRVGADLEILLVTSRETGRWVIPKGWPMKGRTRREAAAIEAVEEAGVGGRMIRKAVGAYDYLKVLRSGESQKCRVTVYAVEVTVQHETWREQDQRSSQWFVWDAAAAAVREPGLGRLIRKFATDVSSGRACSPEMAAKTPEPAKIVPT
jgi:8-oxo-dGTP pyrophosphatase MutT (NUDIX family)